MASSVISAMSGSPVRVTRTAEPPQCCGRATGATGSVSPWLKRRSIEPLAGGQRLNGPDGLISISGVLCRLAEHGVGTRCPAGSRHHGASSAERSRCSPGPGAQLDDHAGPRGMVVRGRSAGPHASASRALWCGTCCTLARSWPAGREGRRSGRPAEQCSCVRSPRRRAG